MARAWSVRAVLGAALLAVVATQSTLTTLGTLVSPTIGQNIEQFIKTASDTCEALPLELMLSRTSSYEMPLTDLVHYTNTSQHSSRVSAGPQHLRLDRDSPDLLIYIPGWLNRPTDESTVAILKALLSKHHSVLYLDTCPSFCGGYVSSVSSVGPLSHLLYDFIRKLHAHGFPVSSIHIVGFSLGAHVAGLTGRLVSRRLKAKLGRITALDPAKPCFVHTEYKLNQRDAKFVQVIHSSSGVIGLKDPLGTVDVYVNGVTGKQPECQGTGISLECAHSLAWRLYSASVDDDSALTGRQCANWDQLVQGRCEGDVAVLGYGVDPESRGLYLYKSKESENLVESESRVQEVRVLHPFELLLRPSQWRIPIYT